ncbi:unnamed protein product [Adineta steineri]|uniref:PHD-type domain-containing protein n=1 Tax=Adineta steineri TaxID=433720 RepID=A0A813MR20_9BILA|nr:unnamed protein product [Adineta steineri]CAF3675895.1 unnamed protein product [Adineta steineri]
MSSSVQCSPSTSSDVVLLPHPLNHVNHNHTETSSTTKSRKRTRSPSLTRDDNNETNHSPTATDTPTKKSRKKRNTTDIDQSLGTHLSADKLHIYQWPIDQPHADSHVLQEQICDYLSLKSFKRKYPDITRRIVDLHEREYLKSLNVVSETQCDLGLTALKLDEVLQLMSIDYPEKYHQFNHVWQQKRRTLLQTHNTNNHGTGTTSTLLSASISNHLSLSSSTFTTSSSNSLDNGDKNRPSKLPNIVRPDLIRSTVEYNTQLQRERRHDRKACFDLQTMQIHYPANRQYRLPSHLTRIGSYPLALVPGQFQDSYIKYESEELKYMPVNTALYYYPKPLSLVHTERFSQQGASSDEEEEGTSTTRPLVSNVSTPQSPSIVNGIGANSNNITSIRITKPSTPISVNSHSNICHTCKSTNDENDEELVACTSCQHRFHPACLDASSEMLTIIKTYPWQCIDCKSCAKCNKTHDEANMMFCDRCDRGYHSYCVGLEAIPDGSWQCSACDPPASTSPAIKGKRGRPSNSSRSSPRQQSSINSPKSEIVPTRVSSRRSHKILSTPLSPSNNTNHSSNSSSTDVQSTANSPSMNLVLTRHQQQWTTIPSNNNNNNNNTIISTNQR